MPAARNKAELLAITHKEYGKLDALISRIDAELALHKDEDDTSIKDVIGHRAHWVALFLGWYRDGQAGKDVAFPAPGYKWSDLKAYNAQLRADQAALSWADVRNLLTKHHADLLNFIESHDDEALYGGPMKGAKNDWTTGRWAEANGPSHYRSAAKYLRTRLRGG